MAALDVSALMRSPQQPVDQEALHRCVFYSALPALLAPWASRIAFLLLPYVSLFGVAPGAKLSYKFLG